MDLLESIINSSLMLFSRPTKTKVYRSSRLPKDFQQSETNQESASRKTEKILCWKLNFKKLFAGAAAFADRQRAMTRVTFESLHHKRGLGWRKNSLRKNQ